MDYYSEVLRFLEVRAYYSYLYRYKSAIMLRSSSEMASEAIRFPQDGDY